MYSLSYTGGPLGSPYMSGDHGVVPSPHGRDSLSFSLDLVSAPKTSLHVWVLKGQKRVKLRLSDKFQGKKRSPQPTSS